MHLLQDVITYVRRIIKSPSDSVITDNLIIDYINRFWITDVDARMQVFDLKTKYQFQTVPGVDQYNMPMYNPYLEASQTVGMFPMYQGFFGPAYVNGIQVSFQTQKDSFFRGYPNVTQYMSQVATGDGTAGPYNFQIPVIGNPPNPPYPLNPPLNYLLRGHVDITGIIATNVNQDPPEGLTLNTSIQKANTFPAFYLTSIGADGASLVVSDSGQFLTVNKNVGLLMEPGSAPGSLSNGNTALPNGYTSTFVITGASQATSAVLTASTSLSVGQYITITGVVGMTELNGNTYVVTAVTGTTVTINVDSTGFTAYVSGGTITSYQNIVNYLTGQVTNVFFPDPVPNGAIINAQCYYFQSGLPRSLLFYNNVLTFRMPPSQQWLVELDAYLSPAAFLTTGNAIPFGYMAEYIARGAARKILSDTGDIEQFMFYEPLFKEQELLVWKRSQRIWTSTRTQTLYSQGMGQHGNNSFGNTL